MHELFLACFIGGLLATAIFVVLGSIGGMAVHGHALTSGHGHALPAPHGHATGTEHALAHGHAHAGEVAHAHAHVRGGDRSGAGDVGQPGTVIPHWVMATAGWSLSWFSPLTLAAAAMWFGGIGLVAEQVWGDGALLVVSVPAGVFGAWIVRWVVRQFMLASTPPLQGDDAGAIGTITAGILRDAPGEVMYTIAGQSISAAARSVEGTLLPRGTAVIVLRRERGIAWVTPIDPLAQLGPPANGTAPEEGDTSTLEE